MTIKTVLLSVLVLSGTGPSGDPVQLRAPLKVVATLPVYASLVREIAGDEVEVTSIAHPNEDAHFVRPKPSFALSLRRADMFVTTGLDLELWVPALLDRAHNTDVLEGGRGYVTAYTGIKLLDIPVAADRSAGDVHAFGNPHITTDPLRALQVARNITTGLKRVAPDRAGRFDAGLASFADKIHRRLFGDRLVDLLGGETLEQMANGGTLHDFLETNEFEGKSLIEELGGWLGLAEPFRGGQLICYHKNWAYLEDRFGVTCAEYVEAKPGIPPTPRHVSRLIERMRGEGLQVLLAASYFDERKVSMVAERGGATVVRVPMSTGAMPGVDDYFSLVDTWVDGLAQAFAGN
ncbi:MAG: zinc ABC transporter substrate-binding protein [Gemmatimonadetes bacterium]|nr:zinc ABC transporter substrate-binding protein [Gemmatimonadota bacterium]